MCVRIHAFACIMPTLLYLHMYIHIMYTYVTHSHMYILTSIFLWKFLKNFVFLSLVAEFCFLLLRSCLPISPLLLADDRSGSL